MAASVDAAPIERDLADVAGAIVVHVEIINVRLAAAHERSLARHPVAIPLGATAPANALPSSLHRSSMNAADGITALERDAKLHRTLATVIGIAIVAAVLLLAGYCAGGRHDKTGLAVAAINAKRDTLRDTIRVVEQRLVVDTMRVRVTADGATVARTTFDSAEKTVDVAASKSDSVASSLVIPAMHLCDVALAKDSIAYAAVVATLADMTIDRNAQRDRADGDEAELKILKPPKFGFRSGLLAGAGVILALAHFVR